MDKFVRHTVTRMWRQKKFPLPWPLPYGGWQFLYNDPQSLYKLLFRYETNVWKYVKNVVSPGMFCLDLGANQGFYTVLLAKLVGPTGKVIAFEPELGELKRLRKNLKLNSLEESDEHLKICETLVGKEYQGAVEFHVPLGEASRSSIGTIPAEVRSKNVQTVRVGQINLDRYLNSGRKVDFMKIDIEGAELGALEGAERILREDRPIIVMEVADVATREVGYQARKLLEFLEARDYEIQILEDRGIPGREYMRCEVAAVPRRS